MADGRKGGGLGVTWLGCLTVADVWGSSAIRASTDTSLPACWQDGGVAYISGGVAAISNGGEARFDSCTISGNSASSSSFYAVGRGYEAVGSFEV